MKEKKPEPSIQGMAYVYQLVMDSLMYFCKAYKLNMNQANVILMLVFYKELTLKELCEHTGQPKSTASRVVDDLVEQEMVERTVPKENRRSVRLSLNKKFAKKLDKLNEDKEFQKVLTKNLPQKQGMMVIQKLDELMAVIHNREPKKYKNQGECVCQSQ